MEAHGHEGFYDEAAHRVPFRFSGLRQAIVDAAALCNSRWCLHWLCETSIPPVRQQGLTMKTGQTHVHRYFRPLLRTHPTARFIHLYIITHRFRGSTGYEIFKHNNCIVVPSQVSPPELNSTPNKLEEPYDASAGNLMMHGEGSLRGEDPAQSNATWLSSFVSVTCVCTRTF